MKKLESLTNNKFALSKVELNNAKGGASEGSHSFLWWTWDTTITTWVVDNNNGTSTTNTDVTRCSDPKSM